MIKYHNSRDDSEYAEIEGIRFPYNTDEEHFRLLTEMAIRNIDSVELRYADPTHPNSAPEHVRRLYENTRYMAGDRVKVLPPRYPEDAGEHDGQTGKFIEWIGILSPGGFPRPTDERVRALLRFDDGKSMTVPRRRIVRAVGNES